MSIRTLSSDGDARESASVPPAGMASRLLVTRFRIASSSSSLSASDRRQIGAASSVSAMREASSFGRATSATRFSNVPHRRRPCACPGRLAWSSIVRTTAATLPICSCTICQPPSGAGIDRGVLLEHLHVSRDQVQRRSDLMRDAGRHLPDRRHLLGPRQRLAQREDALIGVDELLVAHPQLGGRIVHPLLQRIVEMLEPGEHVVQSGRDLADFVGPHDIARAPRSRRRRRAASRRGCARSDDESGGARTSR